jgi:microcystin-dependent protein
MDDVFIGQIMLFAGDFVPSGYVACDGSLLAIADNQELFALLGTYYGGDGNTTFAVPDLRGRIPIGTGKGRGMTNRVLGEAGGEAAVTLTPANLPAHTHTLYGVNSAATSAVPGPSMMFANGAAGQILPYNDLALANGSIGSFSDKSITPAGGAGTAHENRMPSLGIQYVMATQGIFPSPQ